VTRGGPRDFAGRGTVVRDRGRDHLCPHRGHQLRGCDRLVAAMSSPQLSLFAVAVAPADPFSRLSREELLMVQLRRDVDVVNGDPAYWGADPGVDFYRARIASIRAELKS
jgi:hypothetical protein